MATIESNNGLAIIKDYDLKNHFSSLKVGDIVDDLFVRTFSGLFTVNAEDIIEQQKISGWRIETQPGFNSETLGQIKQPLRITPVHNLSPEAHKKSLIAANRAAATSTAVNVISSTLMNATKEIQGSYSEQRDIFEQMFESYDAFKKEEVYGFDHFKIDSSKPSTIEEIDMLLKFMSRRYYDYSEKELGLLTNYKINIPMGDGTPYEVPVLDTRKEGIYGTIAKSRPKTMLSELLRKQDPITGKISDPSFAYGAVYESDEYVEYLEKAGLKGIVAESDTFSKFAYIPEDIYMDFEGEQIENLKLFIDDVAQEHKLNRTKEYTEDVYRDAIGRLQEFDENFYNYFSDMSELSDDEKAAIRDSIEGKRTALTSKQYDSEIARLEKEAVEHNMALQIQAFYDNFEWLRGEDRAYLNGRDTSRKASADFYPDMTEDEKMSRHIDNSQLNRVMQETHDYGEKFKRATHEFKDGKWIPIPERMPQRPTDKIRIAILGDLYTGDISTVSDRFAGATHDVYGEVEALNKEASILQQMIEKPYDPDIPEEELRAVLKEQLDLLVAAGRTNMVEAHAAKEAALKEIELLQTQGAEKVFELNGLSKEAAEKIRTEFNDAKKYKRKFNIVKDFFDKQIFSGFKGTVDNWDLYSGALRLSRVAKYEVEQAERLLSEGAHRSIMYKRMRRIDNVFDAFGQLVDRSVKEANAPLEFAFQQKFAEQTRIVETSNNVINNKGLVNVIDNEVLEFGSGSMALPLGVTQQDYVDYLSNPKALKQITKRVQTYETSQAERAVLEERLSIINERIDELGNKITPFTIDTSKKSFGSALEESFSNMIATGNQNYADARTTIRDSIARVTGMVKEGVDLSISDLQMLSDINQHAESIPNADEVDIQKLIRNTDTLFAFARVEDRRFMNGEVEAEYERIRNATQVIRQKGYSYEQMGKTIVEGDALLQVGLTEDQYLQYREKPKSVSELATRVQKHKVIAEKKRNLSNITSWIDAARSGAIIKSSDNDSIGYKVAVNTGNDTAYLSRPAVKVNELQFADFNISNKKLLEALNEGTLEHSSLEPAFDFTINPDLPSDVRYGDNEYVTLAIDKEVDKLYKRRELSDERARYITKDIQTILSGKEPKYKNLDEIVQVEALAQQEAWQEAESTKLSILTEAKSSIDSMRAKAVAEQSKQIEAKRKAYMLGVDREAKEAEISTLTKKDKAKAKELQTEVKAILEEITLLQEKAKEANESFKTLTSNIAEATTKYKQYNGILNGEKAPKEVKDEKLAQLISAQDTQSSIEQSIFNKQLEVFNEKETIRLAQLDIMIKSMGKDPSKVTEAAEFTQIKMSREDLINNFILGEDATVKNPYSKFFNRLVNSHLTHMRSGKDANKELSGVTSAMLQMFDDLLEEGLELDVTTAGFENRYIMQLNSDARSRSDLTNEQIKRLNFRMEKLENKSPVERLQELLFSEINRRSIAEIYPSDDLGELGRYTNTIQTIYKELALDADSADISGEYIKRQLQDRSSYLHELVSETNKGILQLSAGDIDKILESSAQIRESKTVSWDSWMEVENRLQEFEDNYNDRNITNVNEAVEEIKIEISEAMENNPSLSREEQYYLWDKSTTAEEMRKKAYQQKLDTQAHNKVRNNIIDTLHTPIARLFENKENDPLKVVQFFHKTLSKDRRWNKLVDEDSDHFYKALNDRLDHLNSRLVDEHVNGGLLVQNNPKLAEFERLYKFAFASTINKDEAKKQFLKLEDLVRLLPDEDLVGKALKNGDERVLDQMVRLSERYNVPLMATMQIPDTEHTTNVRLRRAADGGIEAYSSELRQGFIVNDTGVGPTATANMNTARAWTRDNAMSSLDSMSVSRPVLRNTLATYEDIKRKGVAINPSNLTETVVDSVQALKDGSTLMSYDIETTLTGAKQLSNAIQPIEIFAEKFQMNEDGSIKRNADGTAYIDVMRPEEVKNPDGSITIENKQRSINSQFHGVIALNKESMDIIEEYRQGKSNFTVQIDRTKSMHVADIIDALQWNRNMTDTEIMEFNQRKQEFFSSFASGKKLKSVLNDVDKKIEAFHLVNNVAKYSMATADRGASFATPEGTIRVNNGLSSFETYSKVTSIPTHDEIINQLMKNPQGVVDFDMGVFDALFTRDGDTLIRRSPHSRSEADYVLSVQRKYTDNLLSAAVEGATNLATEQRAKEMFGDNIIHFSSEQKALESFGRFSKEDNVAAILGVNVEKADNLTLSQRATLLSPKKADGSIADVPIRNDKVFNEGITKLINERNNLLQNFLSGISEEYAGKFQVNPNTAKSFAKDIEKAEKAGRNIAGVLNDKPTIWVSNASEAISYLPMLSASNANVIPSSESIMEMDNQIARIGHAIDVIKNRGRGIRGADREVFEELDVFGGRLYNLKTRTVYEPSVGNVINNFFENTGVIDQQVLTKLMYPSLRSHAAEEIMKYRGVGTEGAHAADFDVRHSIDVFEDFMKASVNAMNGEGTSFDGVESVIKNIGITADMDDIYEAVSYKPNDFVLLREQYDSDMHGNERNAQGQVGVYRIDKVDNDMKGFSLVRQVMGANGFSDDTSVDILEFRGVTNADFDSKVAQKLEYLPNNDAVLEAMDGYGKDITREHFERMFRSSNSYYQHLNQAESVAKMFEDNPLFNIGRDFDFATTPLTTGDMIGESTKNGYIPIGQTPLDKARTHYDVVNAILEQREVALNVDGIGNATLSFQLGGKKFVIPNNTDRINLAGKNVGFEIFGKEVVDADTGKTSNRMFARLNPDNEWNESTITPEEKAVIENQKLLKGNDKFYTPEISKEHLQSLRDIKQFNDSALGQATRAYMDDVTTLQNLGPNSNGISYDVGGRMIREWNEELKAYAAEHGHTRSYKNLSSVDGLTFEGKKGMVEFNHVLDHTTPMRAVESLTKAANKVMNEGGLSVRNYENKHTMVTNNVLVPQLVEKGFLPAGYGVGNGEREIKSLETIGSDIVNHMNTVGSPNPLQVVDYGKLAKEYDNPESLLHERLNALRAIELNPRINKLSSSNQLAFEQSKELLQDVVDEGMYLGGMKIRTAEIDTDGIRTLQQMSSPSYFSTFSVDQLTGMADARAGSADAVDIAITKGIYRELGNRAVGYDPKNNRIDPQSIIDSGDTERIRAAEALNWVQAYNNKIEGKTRYAPVEDITEHRLVYGSSAGAKIGDVSWRRLQRMADRAEPLSRPEDIYANDNNAVYNQQARMIREWGNKQGWKGHDLGDRPYYATARGEAPKDAEAHAELLRQQNEALRQQADQAERSMYEPSEPQRPVTGFEDLEERLRQLNPSTSSQVNNVSASGAPLLNVSNPEERKDPLYRKIKPEDIETPEDARSSEIERIIGNTKDEIRDKMKSFLHGESGGKWVAGLGVAAAALFAVNSVSGPLKLENRPNGHGVKGITGTPEDDKERGQQRETPSYQGDTANKAYVNAGDKGYTIQAKGRANSSLDSEQLHSAVNNGMNGASSVNINIRDDRSTLDDKWLEDQFSNYINRGHVGDY